MPRPPNRPPRLHRAFFRGTDAVRAGLLTPDQLRGKAWRQLFRDVYVDASVPDSYALRCRSARLILPPCAVLTGRSAACLDGVPIGEPGDPVEVLAPTGTRWRRGGCTLVRTPWLPAEHIRPGSPPTTIPERSVWEIASEPDLVEAVAALDVVFRAGRPGRAEMDPWLAMAPESPAARAIGFADPRAESPQESRTRVLLVLAGFPPATPQYELRADGRFVARLDLAWPEARVAVEYDGLSHMESSAQMFKDRARLNRIQQAGWEVVFVTSPQLRDAELFAELCEQLRSALTRGRRDN